MLLLLLSVEVVLPVSVIIADSISVMVVFAVV